jgi:hypothetical protein
MLTVAPITACAHTYTLIHYGVVIYIADFS